MISDTLSDAIREIDGYLSDPDTSPAYADPGVRADILRVRGEMDRLRKMLDAVPGDLLGPFVQG